MRATARRRGTLSSLALVSLVMLFEAQAFTEISPAAGQRSQVACVSRRLAQIEGVGTACRRAKCTLFLPDATQPAVHLRLRGGGGLRASELPTTPGRDDGRDGYKQLRSLLVPVWLSVFVHMLGVGITLSQLTLYITALGASPFQLGLAISGFSVAQMLGCPVLIALSERFGRLPVMRVCLAGNALASLLTACSGTWLQIALARILAGIFAAAVPVSQAAVTDMVSGPSTTRALSQVAAASSLGIVCGPVVAGLISEVATRLCGAPAQLLPKIVFAVSGVLALAVCVYLALSVPDVKPPERARGDSAGRVAPAADTQVKAVAEVAKTTGRIHDASSLGQPIVRWLALMTSWSTTLTVSTYTLFATQFLGYTQTHINASQSAGAAIAVCMQLWLVPRLCAAFGDARACALGILTLGAGLAACSLVSVQPLHVVIFLAFRAAIALADTSTAALTAAHSAPDKRARNLGLLQSTQAGGRIVSPLLAGWMYERSLNGAAAMLPTGALPFVAVGGLCLLSAPLPLVLRGAHATGDTRVGQTSGRG